MNSSLRPTALALLVFGAPLVNSCSSSTEAASVPTAIVLTPAADTIHELGGTQQFTAVVNDQRGKPITTAVVTWSSSDTTKVKVGSTGLATAIALGGAQVTATSGAASKSAAVTVVQLAARIAKVSGDAQSGSVGQLLPQALVVQVVDSASNAVPAATVTFSLTGSTGSLGTPTPATGANGQAQTTWTLGSVPGGQGVRASVAGVASPAVFTATAAVGAPKSIVKQAGDGQTRGSGTVVLTAPAVSVKDTFGNAVAGVAVTFSVPDAASGSVTGASQTTNASGVATVGSWTLGAVGTDSLLATVNGTSLVAVFTATSQAIGAPANVAVLVGNNQPGLVGYGVNVRPAVLVTDASSSPVPNAAVTFAVQTGGGSVTNASVTTNASGIAQVGKWTLGAAAGVNTLTATVTGSGIAGNPVTFSDTAVAGEFTIQLQYYGNYTPTATEQAAFTAAVTRWEQIIYRHWGPPAPPINDTAGSCGAGEPAVTTTVTDLLVQVSFDSIDGPGKTLAEAGPCYLRIANGQTITGIIKFDTADVGGLISSGQLNVVVLHEMNHIFGFGTLWQLSFPFPDVNCLQLASSPPGTLQDTYFSCTGGTANALAEFDSIGGTTYAGAGQTYGGNKVPVENCANAPYTYPTCGAGTVNGHWRKTVFGDELMTGYISSGANPLSVVTIAADQDLGYTVNYDAADAYTQVFTAPAATGAARIYLGDDIRHGPIYAVDRSGVVRAVIVR